MTKMPDALTSMMKLQSDFMDLLGLNNDGVHFLSSPAFLEASVGMSAEAHEVIAETDMWTKPWKSKPLDDREIEAKIEIIDVLFYLMEAAILSDMTAEDIFYIYLGKLQKNLRRLKSRSGEMDPIFHEQLSALYDEAEELSKRLTVTPGLPSRLHDKLFTHVENKSVVVTQDVLTNARE